MTIREIVEEAFKISGLKIKWVGEGLDEKGYCDEKLVVEIDSRYYRPAEVNFLLGNPSKAKNELGWIPKHNMRQTLNILFGSDVTIFKV